MSGFDPKRTYEAKFHKGPRACRSGALEIIIRPENGWLSSKIRKIAHDADSAKRDSQVKTVTFKSENRTEACKYDHDPEDQNNEKRRWNYVARLRK